MKEYIWRRVLEVSNHIIDRGSTVRDTAHTFGISKSTVHKDVTERLPRVNPGLAERVREILAYNRSQRHLRGGDATRKKYQLRDQAPYQ
ncbi:MAG: sporulation transcriptional regulator SpoIIID [bacterium]|nr:sporulation transcriptional regulator SpoIIID [bacterium]